MYKHAFCLLFAFYLPLAQAQNCVIQGCSSELCLSDTEQSYLSTCIWKAEYACFRDYGVCEANSAGRCGWRQSNDLVRCIQEVEAAIQASDTVSD